MTVVCISLINTLALIKCSHHILTQSFSLVAQLETRFKLSNIDPPTIRLTQYPYSNQHEKSTQLSMCRNRAMYSDFRSHTQKVFNFLCFDPPKRS